ncbi:transcriptional adapter 2-beta isoform X2 [Nematostella vectensis]|uniref:transcriptional adapter 2-beta isoform X1 n=1 Tax=Nematostella vectensis TaxID=45351 RepID=UPI00138FFB3C|nr:transcriptional adapter 2-beta isoform X1 [Nematostella vectensis]XP_032231365.1 transcriptional adapter 2-beta isoform X2 [Nematostella vectensis]
MAANEYHCNYCQADCTLLRLKCAECTDFDLCLQCFCCGAEMGEHKRGHKYQLIGKDCGTFPLFMEDWTAEEETLLLDAIEQHGFGNWEDVADHIGTKTAHETADHYNSCYVEGSVGKVTIEPFKNKIVDHTISEGGLLSPTILEPPPPLDMSAAEQTELGYMPFRDDFEKEYDNDAETLVSGLQFSHDDDDIEKDLKLAQIDMYLRRLQERQHRKNVARQHGLIASKHKIIALRRRYCKEDRDFRDATRIFSRFKPPKDWEEFLNDHLREREVKTKIKELMRYRKNGITKLAAGQEFDEKRLRRERRKENKRKILGGSTPRKTNVSMGKKNDNEKDTSLRSGIIDELKSCRGLNVLSSREVQLCSKMQMKPGFYTTIKTIILKDHLLRRQGVQVKTRYPPNLDKTHRRLIVNFLKESGWISSS